MTKFINERFSPGESPGEAQTQTQESLKRQQCVRATELAKRTGLEIRYAGLSNSGIDSGKVFDESGRKRIRKGIIAENSRKARHFKKRRVGRTPRLYHLGRAVCWQFQMKERRGTDHEYTD